jgi:hypothetical protein
MDVKEKKKKTPIQARRTTLDIKIGAYSSYNDERIPTFWTYVDRLQTP